MDKAPTPRATTRDARLAPLHVANLLRASRLQTQRPSLMSDPEGDCQTLKLELLVNSLSVQPASSVAQ